MFNFLHMWTKAIVLRVILIRFLEIQSLLFPVADWVSSNAGIVEPTLKQSITISFHALLSFRNNLPFNGK
jgi:hypothetical protein